MKTSKSIYAAVCGVLGMALAAPTPVLASDPYGDNPGADELVKVCRGFADDVVGIKRVRGLCTVYYRADDPVGICISLRDQGLLESLGFDGMYDCIFIFES